MFPWEYWQYLKNYTNKLILLGMDYVSVITEGVITLIMTDIVINLVGYPVIITNGMYTVVMSSCCHVTIVLSP